MSTLITCQSISKSYSNKPLFTDISFSIEDEHRLGLIGPNGSGKSTLLQILAGLVEPDRGSVVTRRQLRIAYVPQKDDFDPEQTVAQIVTAAAAGMPFPDHERAASIDSTLAKLDFSDRSAPAGTLSGGWRKRLALACALVRQAELLLLDEPTNHLDLKSILWLEDLLKSLPYAFLLVSHDRAFLEGVTNRVMELNPTYPQGHLSVSGNYSQFLAMREEQLSAQRNQQQALASQVRREIAWLQRGARARQTKAQDRIKRAGKLVEDLAEVKQRNSMASAQIELDFESTGRKTKELVVLKGVSKSFAGEQLIANLDLLLTSRSKLGLIGRNGSGKTTLLKLIADSLQPDKGTVVRAKDLKIVWFDQNREQLDQTKTLAEALCAEGDHITTGGRTLHIATWANKFLFKSDQLRLPISYLSGGEQARILLANVMAKPADILILDEPTNDLDIPSIEVLEETLMSFSGAVILVTHDRMMLDTVSHQLLALDGRGGSQTFSGYEQFEECSDRFLSPPKKDKMPVREQKASTSTKPKTSLSTGEKRELAALPEKIEEIEKQIAKLEQEMAKQEIATDYGRLQALTKQQEELKSKLEEMFQRWQELEELQSSLQTSVKA